jgi:hypothetical protein
MSDKMKCFWDSGCSDSARCCAFGSCVAAHQNKHKHEISRPAPVHGDVHTETNCPTCGSAVKVGGDGETHYYIPITAPCEVMAFADAIESFIDGIAWTEPHPDGKCGCEEGPWLVDAAKVVNEIRRLATRSRQPSGPGWLPVRPLRGRE